MKTKIGFVFLLVFFASFLWLRYDAIGASVAPTGEVHIQYRIGADKIIYDTEQYRSHSFFGTTPDNEYRASLGTIVSTIGGVTVVELEDGNQFGFCEGGFKIGDRVVVVLFGNNTPEVYDDGLVAVRHI